MKTIKKIIIFKNDRIGDLIPSVPAINLLIENNKDKEIIIYLSEINYKMNFLFEYENVKIIKVNYNLTYSNRIKLIFFFLTNIISEVYIIRPKYFFFILPLLFFFKKTKYYALCLNGKKNYRRPSIFFRKFLSNFIINDRETQSIRPSRKELQLELVDVNWKNKNIRNDYNFDLSNELKKILPKHYCLIHYKKNVFEKLSWGKEGLLEILENLKTYYPNIILINDIDGGDDNLFFKKRFDWFDFRNKDHILKNNNILYFENIDGLDLFNVVRLSKKTIACHGTITLLGNLVNTPILDLFNCDIKSRDDFYQYKNSFHEHVPKNNYDFIIPSTDIKKTLRKMKFSIKK
jgi:hypothetical protein